MKRHITTDGIHAGEHPEWYNRAVIGHITPSTLYEIETTKDVIEGNYDYIYPRLINPSRKSLQEKLATMEQSEGALATCSGMSAIAVAFMSQLRPGDIILAQNSLYGGTFSLMTNILPNFYIRTIFVPKEKLYDLSWAPKNAKLVYIESPSNPTLRITDIRATVKAAKERGLKVFFDNTFATFFLQRPLELGVDVDLYSATKFLNGHSDVLAGVIAGNKETIENADNYLVQFGSPLDPFSCFLLGRGLKTLAIRMAKAQSNAMEIARFLANDKKVTRVFYPGLWNDSDRELAVSQMSGFGAVVTFEVRGGIEGSAAFFDNCKLIFKAGSLGGVESNVSIPVLMSHHHLNEEEFKTADITPGMLRLSVGIEENTDLIEDIKQALAKIP